jgi:hypothetical protein
MSDAYEIGYKKPPRQHQFKPGNQAARGRKRKKQDGLSIPDIIGRALATRRKIKRGNEIIAMPVAEILVERLVQVMTTGTARDMAMIIGLLERYAPDLLTGQPETLTVRYHRAEGSTVSLPPSELWDGDQS